MSETKTKAPYKAIHIVITIALMLFFGLLPAPDPITPLGMKILGIFIGMVYGWSTTDQIWPSLFGITMLAVVDYNTVANVIIGGWGNTTIWTIVMILIFAQAVSEAGITEYLALRLIGNRFFVGKAWLFTGVIFLSAYLITAITSNPFIAIIILWKIVYDVADVAGYQKKDAWPSMAIFGIVFSAGMGTGAFPHQMIPLMAFGAYQSMGGPSINYGSYVVVFWGIVLLVTLLYLLICKYVLRIDVEKLSKIDVSTFSQGTASLDKRQKVLLATFVIMVICFFCCNMLPKSWLPIAILNKMGLAGLSAIFVAIASFLRVDGRPLFDFQKAASNGVLWSVVLLTSAALPISTALTSEGTGVQDFLIAHLGPMFAGKNIMLFAMLASVLALIITNFASNMVTALVFIAVVVSVSGQLGANPTAIVVLLVTMVHVAVLTPAACPMAGMLFANAEWMNPTFIYKHAGLILVLTAIIVCTYGYLTANLLF